MFQRQNDDSVATQDPISASLGLISDANSIREQIVDEFSCEGRVYGYYADVANDCQLFHVCYPVQYPDGATEMIKWSFICPNQTIFDQVTSDQTNMTCLSFPLPTKINQVLDWLPYWCIVGQFYPNCVKDKNQVEC